MILSGLDQACRLAFKSLLLVLPLEEKDMETYMFLFASHLLVSWLCIVFLWKYHVGCTLLLQIDFMYYANTDLLLAFHCDTEVSYG